MGDHPYGWLSLAPPIVAILLAIITRRVLLSLLIGIIIAVATISYCNHGPEIAAAGDFFSTLCESILWKNLIAGDHMRIFAFTLLMSCMVTVMHRAGAMGALVRMLEPIAKGRRSTQMVTWLLGLVVFFDDYANTLLLGNSMRSVTDRWGISREKLAYLVDSTAAPVAGLALISTWIAGEIGYIAAGFREASLEDVDGFAVFVQTIPYRFYVLWALAYVAIIAVLGRDFGPMLAAERRSLSHRRTANDQAAVPPTSAATWIDVVAPIGIVVLGTFLLLYTTGYYKTENPSGKSWVTILWTGDSYIALLYSSAVGLAASVLLSCTRKLLSVMELKTAIRDGAVIVIPSLGILWLSWSLSDVTGKDHLQTGPYLARLVQDSLPLAIIPTVTFVLAAAVAFSTGTSWGTMGLLMPTVIAATTQIMKQQGVTVSPEQPILLASIGGVLAGAIFGDHCSPISDTTVLSSQASGCDHIAHVRTQLPYAIVVGIVSIVFGTIPVGFGISPYICLPLGTVALIGITLLVGRTTD